MKLYLIRHGKTLHNVENRHQNEHSQLLEESLTDVANLAPKLKDFNIEIIFSSPYTRTLKTAEIINDVLNVQLETDLDLKEVKRPTVIEGRVKTDTDVLKVRALMDENRRDESWHHSDEENFYDLRNRVARFIRKIESYESENILVVTHNIIIKMIVAQILFTSNVDVETYSNIYEKISVSNIALSTCEYKNGNWKLLHLNVEL